MLSSEKFLTSNSRTTKRRTRNSISQHKIEIKEVRKEEIICDFNSQEMVAKINEKEILSVTCFSCTSE
jgi:hypothetical protein